MFVISVVLCVGNVVGVSVCLCFCVSVCVCASVSLCLNVSVSRSSRSESVSVSGSVFVSVYLSVYSFTRTCRCLSRCLCFCPCLCLCQQCQCQCQCPYLCVPCGELTSFLECTGRYTQRNSKGCVPFVVLVCSRVGPATCWLRQSWVPIASVYVSFLGFARRLGLTRERLPFPFWLRKPTMALVPRATLAQ